MGAPRGRKQGEASYFSPPHPQGDRGTGGNPRSPSLSPSGRYGRKETYLSYKLNCGDCKMVDVRQ